MCKSSPGLRCSYHAKATLEAIEIKVETDPSPKNLEKLATAQYNYNSTPGGIAKLQAEGREFDVQHFQEVRSQQEKTYKEAMEVKAQEKAKATKAQSDYLNSPEGIAELRSQGDQELADKLEARLHGTNAPAVISQQAPNFEQIDSPTMASLITVGILHGALSGAMGGKFSTGVSAGVRAAQKHNNKVTSAQDDQARKLEAFDKEMERERLAREREHERWNKQVDAELKRYMSTNKHRTS